MKLLIDTLREHTQELKDEYFEQVRVWAEISHAKSVEIAAWKVTDWCKFFNITPRVEGKNIYFPKNFYNTTDSRTFSNMRGKHSKIARRTVADYSAEQKVRALDHYNASLKKLVVRLNSKGIGETVGNDLEIISGKVGVNFEINLKVRDVKVKAWTIVASGAVQQPHYRYLVK